MNNVLFKLKDDKIKKKTLYNIFKKLDESVVEQYWKNEEEVYDINYDGLVLLRRYLDSCVCCEIFDVALINRLYKKFKWLDPDSYELKDDGNSLCGLVQNIEKKPIRC